MGRPTKEQAEGRATMLALPADPLGSSSLPARIHEILEEAIIEGALAPGQRVHADDLAQHYGVSRIPVREALRSLHADGWVEIRPRYGVYVRRRSGVELTELFETRTEVEGVVARLAARRRDDDDLDDLATVVRRSRRAASRPGDDALFALNRDFYDVLRRSARNDVLAGTAASLGKRARFYYATVASQLGRDWVDVHEQLLDAVTGRDELKAEDIARRHVHETGEAVSALLD